MAAGFAWSVWEIGLASVRIVVFYGGFARLITNIGMRMLYGRAREMLRELMTNEDAGVAMNAAFYLRESEWAGKPPDDWW